MFLPLPALPSSLRLRFRPSRLIAAFGVLTLAAACLTQPAFAVSATGTTLAVTAGGTAVTTVASGTVVTLTATVASTGGTPTPGQVNFCDATAVHCTDGALLGVAQVIATGQNGFSSATFKFRPAAGTHSYSAMFVGTTSYATSTSGALSLTVSGSSSTTTIAQSGTAGNYTLTATTTSTVPSRPTGTVTFQDTTASNATVGSSTLTGGSSSFAPGTATSLASVAQYAGYVTTGDFNGDGIPDLLVSDANGGTLRVFLGDGIGGYTAQAAITSDAQYPSQAVVGDFNGDGKLDFAVANQGNPTAGLYIYLGRGDGTFTLGNTYTYNGGLIELAVADVNRDGNLDLIAVAQGNQQVITYFGNGAGAFSIGPVLSLSAYGQPFSITVADFNGDGYPDLLLPAQSGLYYATGNTSGDGSFTLQTSPVVGSSPRGLAVGDFNGDGKPDFVVGNFGGTTAYVFLNPGTGAFGSVTPTTLATGSYPTSVGTADFNGDGNTDIVIGNYIGSNLSYFLGTGTGTFTSGGTVSTGANSYPDAVITVDANIDGFPDVVALTQSTAPTAVVLLSGGSATATATATGVNPRGSGTHQIQASYAGDNTHSSSVSGTTGVTATQVATTLTLTASPATSTYGSIVTLTATLNTTAAMGTVTFYGPNGKLGTSTVSSGVATLTVTSLPVGANSVYAIYDGDAGDTGSTSTAVTVTVLTPATAVGSTSAPQQVVLNFTSTVTLNSTLATAIQVVTQGAANLDFKYANGGTCAAGATYTSGQSCTVNFVFTPTAPGLRLGAVVLFNSAATPAPLATAYISATGTGPLAVYTNGVETSMASNSNQNGLTTDAAGNIYYTSYTTNSVYKIAAGTGTVTVLASGLGFAVGVAVDGAGNIFYADRTNNKVLELVGGTGTPVVVVPSISLPEQLTFDGAGNLYVASSTLNSGYVRKYLASSFTPSTTYSSGLAHALGVAVNSAGTVFITDFSAGTLLQVTSAGVQTTIDSGLSSPAGVVLDAAGNLYVGTASSTLYRYTAGTFTKTAFSATFASPYYAAIDSAGNMYVAERGSVNAIDTFTRGTGTPLTFANTAVGATSAAKTLTLENDGNAALTISSIAPSNNNFSFIGATVGSNTACSTTVASGALCGLSATFSPLTATPITGTGTIADNSLNTPSQQTVALNGTGTVGTKTINFPQPPSQPAGTSYTLTATASDSDAVTYAITGGTGTATISGNVVMYLSAGTVQITASSAATANAAAATPVVDTITVTAASTTFTAPATAVGTTSATQTAEVTFTVAGTPASINVVTQGLVGYDYNVVAGGTCSTATAYTVGQACSVLYTLTPTAPGQRLGAVTVTNSTGTVLATSLLAGTGTGPLALFQPGVLQTTYSTTLSSPRSLAVDAAGNVFLANQYANTILKYPAGSTTPVTLVTAANNTTGVTVDGAGNVFYSTSNSSVYELVGGVAGSTPILLNSSISNPDDNLAVDAAGNLYLSNQAGTIYKLPAGNYGNAVTLVAASGSRRFIGIALDASGNLFAVDFSNNVLYELVSGGSTLTPLFSGAPLNTPHALAIDAAGNLYVGNANGTNKILRFAAGAYSATPTALSALGQYSVAVGPEGSLYAIYNTGGLYRYIRNINPALTFTAAVGSASAAQSLVLENDGNAALTINSISPSNNNYSFIGAVAGSNAACGTTLTAAGACGLSATFVPQASGSQPGTGTVADNSLNVATQQTVSFTGTGTATQPTITGISPATGPTAGGTTVTITGMNLTGTTVVKFGANNATSFTVQGNTSITAVSPAGSGTVDITVGNGTYTSTTGAADQFTYLTAQAISFTQPTTPAFVGSAATLVATGGASGNAVTFSIVSGTATLSGTNNSTITYTTAGTVVIAANQAGNGTYLAAAQVTRTVTVLTQSVFIVNSGGTVTTKFDGGTAQSTSVAGGGIGAAVDASGSFWSVYASGAGVSKFTDAGALSANYTATNLTSGTAVAIDGNGTVWISQGGAQNNVFAISNAGAVLSTTGFAQAGALSTPASITINAAGSLWLANQGNNTVTEVIGVAAPVTTPTVQQVINVNPGTKP